MPVQIGYSLKIWNLLSTISGSLDLPKICVVLQLEAVPQKREATTLQGKKGWA